MKYNNSMKKAPLGSKTYDTPYSDVRPGAADGDRGYVAGGLDIIKAVPGKGKKGGTKKTKSTRRAY